MSSDLVFGVVGSVVAVLLTVLVGTVYRRRSPHSGDRQQPHIETNEDARKERPNTAVRIELQAYSMSRRVHAPPIKATK